MERNEPIPLLGLALRGGRLAVGEEAVRDTVRTGKARLLLLASDASERTRRHAAGLSTEGQVLLLSLPCTKEELGRGLGREEAAVAAMTDAGLAAAVGQRLASLDPETYGPAAERLELKLKRAKERQDNREREKKAEKRPVRPRGNAPEERKKNANRPPREKREGQPPVWKTRKPDSRGGQVRHKDRNPGGQRGWDAGARQFEDRKPEEYHFDDRKLGGRRFDGRKPEGRRFDDRKPEGRRFDDRKPGGRRFDDRKPEGRRFDDRKPEGRRFDDRKPEGRRFDDRKPGARRHDGQSKDTASRARRRPGGGGAGKKRRFPDKH